MGFEQANCSIALEKSGLDGCRHVDDDGMEMVIGKEEKLC